MLMRMFFESVQSDRKAQTHFLEFMQRIHGLLHDIRARKETDALRLAADQFAEGLDLLCLDDVRIDDIADAMIVGRLFERLFESGTMICATSNCRPDDLYRDGLNRHLFLPFASLMEDRTEIIEMAGELDYRSLRIAGQRRYMTPIDIAAKEEIDRIWSKLAEGGEQELTLNISGRQLKLARFYAGVLRADFRELCECWLGPPDFLAIARETRLIILENIPRFGSQNRDAARRFMNLIDALYEAGTKLIATADEPPDKLYETGLGAFEFRRTVSRLNEMSSPNWGAAGAVRQAETLGKSLPGH